MASRLNSINGTLIDYHTYNQTSVNFFLGHPVHEEFINGNHSVGRSSKPFCQVWSDMALEQSINCHSKSKSGVIGFTKKAGALDRWFINAHERASVTRQMLSMLDLAREDARHKELGKARILRDEEDVKKVVESLLQIGVNPFKDQDSRLIQNIVTGTVASQQISDDLLQARASGTTAMDQFVLERLVERKVPFFDTVKKMKLHTFSNLKKTTKTRSNTGETLSITTDRQLFGRIVVVAKTRDIDLKHLLSHELSPVPLALAKPDGTLNKTQKQTLLVELEKNANSSFPTLPITSTDSDTAWMIDGMAIIQMMKHSALKTFNDLSRFLFNQIIRIFESADVKRVDVLFDRYDVPNSIKSLERERRNQATAFEVRITNPNTPLPKQWDKFLADPRNKRNLTEFLSNSWITLASSSLAPNQIFVTGGGFHEIQLCKMVSRNPDLTHGTVTNVEELFANHEEADTRMLLHASHAASTCNRVVIWSPDTDVSILMIQFSHVIDAELWLKTGVKHKTRYINIDKIAEQLGFSLCQILLPLHALTGCDSVSSFCGKGKIKPWRMILEDASKGQGFQQLGDSLSTDSALFAAVETFVCSLYEKGTTKDVNMLRYRLFCHKQARNEGLPPTKDSLVQHTKRANLQAYIWKHALEAMQPEMNPVGHGWHLENGKLVPLFTTKEAAPSSVLALTQCGCSTNCSTRICKCVKHGLPCTEACACAGETTCHNSKSQVADISSDSDSDLE